MQRTDYSGKTMILANGLNDPYAPVPEGAEYNVEGYWKDITGESWMNAFGNPACMNYAIRSSLSGLPLDDEVLYGKVGALGYLVHVSEVSEKD